MAASTTFTINAEVADKKLETTNTITELNTSSSSSSSAPSECKTVFKILSNIKNNKEIISSDPNPIQYLNDARILSLENDEDILLLKRDPTTNQSSINKSAYFKLHKSSCPGKSNTLDKIKEKYENKSDSENIEPIIVGFHKVLADEHQHSSDTVSNLLGCDNKPPIAAKPRNSKLSKSQIITPTKKVPINARRSLNIEKNKSKDVNSNELCEECSISDEEEDQYITIVRRSTSSEESVTKFDKELSAFVMDNTKKKSGLKKFFSVFSSSKDKKKKQEKFNKQQNGGDSVKNDANNFNRQSSYRHTTGPETCINPVNLSALNKIQRSDSSSVVTKVPNKYSSENSVQMHNINQYNYQQKQNFDNSFNNGYTPMDKPFPSSLNNPYMNIPNVRKFIDTSSSASTLDHESERFNFNQTEISGKSSLNDEEEPEIRNYPYNSFRANRISDDRRDTPPRLIETQQDVRLVNPKASIPINSERALPNPYHQNNNGNRESPKINTIPRKIISPITPPISPRKTYLNDTYGTVFDNVDINKEVIPKGPAKPPRLPSVIVESSKLRLPQNREIIPLSPRMKSPIPPENVSTDKIIATELLKPKINKPSAIEARNQEPSHQNLEIDIDYPEDLNYASKDSLLGNLDRSTSLKPPLPSPRNLTENLSRASRSSNESVILRNNKAHQSMENNRITTDVQVHASSPLNRTPTPINYASSNQNLSLSPRKPTNLSIRSATPPGSRISESPKTTPQKEDMRKSVEAYYWKEIKKLKDQENYELYMMQMQYGQIPYGETIHVRRSRSMSPLASRNGRRSLSLPRETRPPQQIIIPERIYPNVIPENQPMVQLQPRSMQQLQFQQQQYFLRNTPERSTIDGSPSSSSSRNTNSLYRPIFKRGSLNSPQKAAQCCDDTLKRKVSFSGAQAPTQVWPTKNGFTQSPPQRRMDKLHSLGEGNDDDNDDVFYDTNQLLRNDLPINNEEIYYNSIRQGPPLMLRASQNSLYLSQISRRPSSQHHHQQQQEEETLYGQPMDTLLRAPPSSRMPRYGSIQIQEELYGYQQQRPSSRRISYQNVQHQRPSVPSSSTPSSIQSGQLESPYGPLPHHRRSQNNSQIMHHQVPRREVIVNDEIFGQFGGYTNSNNVRVIHQQQSPQTIYNSRQSISIAGHNLRVRDELYQRQPIHYQNNNNKQQISVSNKVCDIYGKIHDVDPNNKHQQVQQSGVLMGQLQPGSPVMVRQMEQQPSSGQNYFIRNNRLTASANDMQIRRVVPPQQTLYGRLESNNNNNYNVPPSRPLPPVPQKKGLMRGISDTESGSDASEIQRIMNGGGKSNKNKKKGFFSSK